MNARRWLPALFIGLFVVVSTQSINAQIASFPSRLAVLTATTNAPIGAGGVAVLSPGPGMEMPMGGTFPITNGPPTLSVTTEGLLVGTYTVSITDTATNSYELGTFTVMIVTNPVATPDGQAMMPASPVLFTTGSGTFPLPAGLSPFSVAGVFVADTNNLVDLSGSFLPPVIPPPPIYEQAVLTATTNAPAGAAGFAVLSSIVPWMAAPSCIGCPFTNVPTVRVTTKALLVGTYTASVTDRETNIFVLGSFDVKVWTNPVIVASGSVTTLPNLPVPIPITIGGGIFPLPSGLDATNVVSMLVLDTNSLVDLTGTFQQPLPPPPVFHKVAVLAPTADAPSNAMGRAALEVEAEDGTNVATVAVRTLGLLVGSYTVSVADQTGTSTTLGSFDVNVLSNEFCRPPSPTALGGITEFTAGGGSFTLPSGLDATNVTTITVADTNGVDMLTGDFTKPLPPFPCNFFACASLVPGPTATSLFGNAQLQIRVLRGKALARFSLTASGLPANTKLNLTVNGVQAGSVKSNRRGFLTVRRLPKNVDPASVTAVTAEDGNGNVVFSVGF